MSFRITPEDVGRKARAKNGMVYLIFKGGSDSYPYMTDKGACTSEGKLYYSDGTSGDDLVSWVDKTTTDQDTDQPCPKDLRDEVAMVALASMVPSEGYRLAHKDTQSTVDEMAVLAYLFADAMMKAREK